MGLFKRFYLFLDRGEGIKRGRETSMCGSFSCAPYWRPGPKPKHVPWLGIELATPWFAGWHSIHRATPARVPKCLLERTAAAGLEPDWRGKRGRKEYRRSRFRKEREERIWVTDWLIGLKWTLGEKSFGYASSPPHIPIRVFPRLSRTSYSCSPFGPQSSRIGVSLFLIKILCLSIQYPTSYRYIWMSFHRYCLRAGL